MTDKQQNTVLHHATIVRDWAELNADPYMVRFGLKGLCVRTSAILFSRLNTNGIRPRFMYTANAKTYSGHVFLRIDNSLIDVTATQFGLAERIIVRRLTKSLPWYWSNIEAEFKSLRDLKRFTHHWPSEQKIQRKDLNAIHC